MASGHASAGRENEDLNEDLGRSVGPACTRGPAEAEAGEVQVVQHMDMAAVVARVAPPVEVVAVAVRLLGTTSVLSARGSRCCL